MHARTLQDQFSRPLMQSTSRNNVLALFADALRGKDLDERVATGEQLAVDLRKPSGSRLMLDAQHYVHDLDKVDARRSADDYENELAVGDRCCPPGPNTGVYCTADGRRICDYDRVGQRTLSVTGGGIITLSPQPGASFSWWRPRLIRMFAHDVTNPSIPRWEGDFLTLIQIGQHPVEGFSTAPAAGVVDGIHMADFVTPDNSGIPVGWPDFSITGQSNQLTVSGISLWQVGVLQLAYLTIMGNPLNERNGNAQRCNGNSTPPSGIPGTSTGGSSSVGGDYRTPRQGPRGL